MNYKQLCRIYGERKEKLSELLTDAALELKPSRRDQIKGAIDEIDMFLTTLEQYRERENEQGETLLNRISELLRSPGDA
jgi:hypothetical protein